MKKLANTTVKIKKVTVITILLILSAALLLFFCSCSNKGFDIGKLTDEISEPETIKEEGTTAEYTYYEPRIDSDADSIKGIAIRSAEDLAKIGVDEDYPLDGDYVLVTDIDLSGYKSWEPIGGAAGKSGQWNGKGIFTGTFDGRNHIIWGLTIDAAPDKESFWGLFGTVASKSEDDPAVIKNVVLSGVSIQVVSSVTNAVGALAGQVNGYVEIDGVSVLSGVVSFLGSNNLGVGGVIGQIRTDSTSSRVSNMGVSIKNIFSNVTVTAENGGTNYCSGVIGRIRGGNIKELSSVVVIGKTIFEGGNGFAITTGDSGARRKDSVYYQVGSGNAYNSIGQSVPKDGMTNGSLIISDDWTVAKGFYPLLSDVYDSPAFSVMELITFSFHSGENKDAVKSNFTVATKVADISVKWYSSNPDIVSVGGQTVKVTQPASGYVDVTLTAVSGGLAKDYKIRVISSQQGYFINDYVVAGEPIRVGGYAEGTEFKWIIENKSTGKTKTVLDTTGSYTPKEEDLESLITVQALGYEDISLYYSYLPVIYITTDKAYNAIGKGGYTDGYMKLAADVEDQYLYDGKIGIKLRGNSTARWDKRPFKIKLDTKTNLLGIDKEGPNKHWVLLANYIDPTLMRNKIINDFSYAIGMEYYMASENVVLIYNGKYYGVYQLCEHIRVDETRVNIFDWEEYAETAAKTIAAAAREAGEVGYAGEAKLAQELENELFSDWSWMKTGQVKLNGKTYVFTDYGMEALPPQTGGFLLEMDFYSIGNEALPRTETAYRQPFYFNTPNPEYGLDSFKEQDLYKYAYRYIQSFEYAIHSDDFIFRNSDTHYRANVYNRYNYNYVEVNYKDDLNDGRHYSELFDMDNLVANFIFCEIIMNWDSMKNSTFVYKDIDGLAKLGPQWDFDWAWGNTIPNPNTWRPTSWHCREFDFMVEQYYQTVQWNCLLIRDPYFLVKAYEKWHEIRNRELEDLIKKGGIIDNYTDFIRKAARGNDNRWGFVTFDTSLSQMWNFINTRMKWLDEQFKTVESLIKSLGVYHSSNDLRVTDVTVLTDKTKITAKVNNTSIDSVAFQINGTTMVKAKVNNGTATVTVDTSAIDITGGYNCVTIYAIDSTGDYIYDEEHSIKGNYNQVVSNYKYFVIK